MALIRLNTRSLPDDAVTGAKIENNPTIAGNLTAAQKLGVLGTNDLGLGVHIKEADSGASSVSTDADQLVIENSGESGITLLAGTSSASRLAFGDSGNSNIGMVYYNHASDFMHFSTNDSVKMKIDSTGIVTKPFQPSFSTRLSGTQSNLAVGSGQTIQFNQEYFDIGGNFNTSNYTFTAPVTGKYQLNARVYLNQIDTASAYYIFTITTSNRTYVTIIDPNFSADVDYFSFNTSVLADMDLNDTAYVTVHQNNGTAQTDVTGADSGFNGILIG